MLRRRPGLRRAAVLAILAATPGRAEPPHRVLSLNLCTDQLLLTLAGRSDVVGVTRLARDCRISAVCAEAAAVPTGRGTAEEMIAARPDLVLAGSTGAGTAVAAARRLGVTVVDVPDATSLDSIRQQIETVAGALGRPAQGRAAIAAFDDRLAAIPAAPPGPHPVAAVYEPNGFLAGQGSLAAAVLARAGLDDYATTERVPPGRTVSLEQLLWRKPDLLVTDQPLGAPSLAEAALWHKALADAFPRRRVTVPARDWICGSPATLDAVERLAMARAALQR
jgi:iron complex transport system substrate-binding protein